MIAQNVVSKAEGRVRRLNEVGPGERAFAISREHAKDARLVQVVLDETAELLRAEHGVLICETRQGFVCANAGVDLSNAPDADVAILLPVDPDQSARQIRAALRRMMRSAIVDPAASGPCIGVVIADSFGRAWRLGSAAVAIGAAGVEILDDWRGARTPRVASCA